MIDYDGTDELVSSAARACVLKISTNVNLLRLVMISGMTCIQSYFVFEMLGHAANRLAVLTTISVHIGPH